MHKTKLKEHFPLYHCVIHYGYVIQGDKVILNFSMGFGIGVRQGYDHTKL